MSYSSSNVPAATSMLEILLLLSQQRGPVGAKYITDQLGLPRSTVYHLLRIGSDQEFILHYPEEKKYGLGPSAAQLSSAYARREPMVRLASPLLPRMVDEAGENGHLSTLYGPDIVYLLAERAEGKRSLVSTVGVRLLAHATASGRAILAKLTDEQLKAMYSNADIFLQAQSGWRITEGLEDDRTQQYTNLEELRRALDRVRERGYAEEQSEVTSGFSSVAVAVCDRSGWPVAAMTLTYSQISISEEKKQKLIKTVSRYASLLEKRITL